MDTYKGCMYKLEETPQLTKQDVGQFTRWLNKTMGRDELELKTPEEIAFRNRIPLKIGVDADPFPYNELDEKSTYGVLKIMDELDYPLEISTKNPEILLEFIGDFDSPNWSVKVILNSMNEKLTEIVEPNAPTPIERMEAIERLTELGIHVMIDIKPFIHHKLNNIEEVIKIAKERGCWGFMVDDYTISEEFKKELGKKYDIKMGDGTEVLRNYKGGENV